MPNERYEDMCDKALAGEQQDNRESNIKERIKELTEEMTKPIRQQLPRYPTNFTGHDLTFAQLREANVNRCNVAFHPFEDWSGTDWSNALMGEVGELFGAFAEIVKHSGSVANLIKKMNMGEGIDLLELSEEIADIQIYLDLLAARFKIDLAGVTIKKFNKVSDKRGSTIKL